MDELSEKDRKVMQQKLLSALGLDESEESCEEHVRLLEDYQSGMATASYSLRLDANDLRVFDESLRRAIASYSDKWPHLRKGELRAMLIRDHSVRTEFADRAIDLGLRVWLMLDCSIDASTVFPKKWAEDEPIGDFVASRFDTIDADDDMEAITRFPRKFRAVNLEKLGNITVQWTSFLDEHLRFDEDNREVKIFNNKPWLVAMLKRSQASTDPAVQLNADEANLSEKQDSNIQERERKEIGIPRALIVETLKTLDVLFPPWHEPTEKFLTLHKQIFHRLSPVARDVPKLREFKYWRHRLLDLIVEYESPPLDWTHIWRDRRNPTAFWTFWIGIAIFVLTLVFGITASVLAGIQIELAKAALNVGNQGEVMDRSRFSHRLFCR